MPETEQVPTRKLVLDSRTRRIGEVMDKQGPYYQLRPLGGGREWDARPEDLQQLSQEEEIRAKLGVRNRGSQFP